MLTTLGNVIKDAHASASAKLPAGLVLSLAAYGIHPQSFLRELIGTVIMIGFTFPAGKWIGADSLPVAWACHAIGVILADKIGGGYHVNPAVSTTMYVLGEVDYNECYARIAGAMAGGILSFPFYLMVTDATGLTPLGGPDFSPEISVDAFISECVATCLLLLAIFILNWEMHFGKFHYYIKQFLTALAIRSLIEFFPTAGPALNPMLGTAWAIFATGKIPDDPAHFFVYWVGCCLGGFIAALLYAIYAGKEICGKKVTHGPF